MLKKLTHLSVISCHEDVPRELPAHSDALLMDRDIDYKQLIRHCTDVPVMLMDLQVRANWNGWYVCLCAFSVYALTRVHSRIYFRIVVYNFVCV